MLGDALQQLKGRADRLYRPRARRNALITPAVKSYREAVKQTRELAIRPADYAALREQIEAAEAQRQELERQQRTFESELRWLQRSRDALPILRRYAALQEQLQALRKLPSVPTAFIEALAEDLTELETRQRVCAENTTLLEQVAAQLGQLHLQPQVLEQTAINARLIGRQESYVERRERLQQATTSAREIELQLQRRVSLLFDDADGSTLSLQEVPSRALPAALQMRCHQLASELESALSGAATLRQQLESVAQETQHIRSRRQRLMQSGGEGDAAVATVTDIASAAQTGRLGLALEQALVAEAVLQELSALEQQRDSLLASIEVSLPAVLQPLRPLTDTGNAIESPVAAETDLIDVTGQRLRSLAWRCARLPVPLQGTLQQHRDSAAALLQLQQRNEESLRDCEQQRTHLSDELRQLQSSGLLPSEADLQDLRKTRSQRWYELAEAWRSAATAMAVHAETGSDDGIGEHPRADVERADVKVAATKMAERHFLDALSETDLVADRLRLEADRIARGISLSARIESSGQQRVALEQVQGELAEQQRQSQQAWQELWSGCCDAPLSPVEMLEWREKWLSLSALSVELEQVLQSLTKRQRQVDSARLELLSAAGESTDSTMGFTALLQQTRLHQQQLTEAQGSLATLDQQLAELSERDMRSRSGLEQQQSMADAARSRWQEVCVQAGLPPDLDTTAAIDLMQQREALITEHGDWLQQGQQNEQESHWLAEYEQAVKEVTVNLDITAATTEQQVEKLATRQQAALEVASQHQVLTRTRDERKQALDTANASLSSRQESLQRKRVQLDLDATDDLATVLDVLQQRARLDTQLADLREDLIQLADGEELDQLRHRMEAIDADEADARVQQLQQSLQDLQVETERLLSHRVELLQRQRELDQADTAAVDARQRGSDQAAELQAHSRQYLVTRIAQRFLQAQLDSYREQHQGPLLEHASARFSHLTCGEFSRLKLDYGDADAIELKAQRAGGQLIPVNGLSDGTRDQLFLSLRLASLQLHFEKHEPMPLVVDDLLITFDDRRAAAALELFADLATTTQVLLFTHHQHVVDFCNRLPSDKHACLHQLR